MERRKKCKQYGPVKLKIYQPPSRTFCIFKREPSSNVPDESSPLLSCLPNFTPTSRDRTDAPSLRQTDSTSVRSSKHPLHTGCLKTSCISSCQLSVQRIFTYLVVRYVVMHERAAISIEISVFRQRTISSLPSTIRGNVQRVRCGFLEGLKFRIKQGYKFLLSTKYKFAVL